MLTDYLNQTATLESYEGNSAYGATFTDAQTIKIRYEGNIKRVRDNTGQEVVSNAVLFTQTAIKPQDKVTINGQEKEVISVSSTPDLDGKNFIYEARI